MSIQKAIKGQRGYGINGDYTEHIGEMKDFVEQTLKINAYACMEKPLDLDRLLEIMQNVLEAKSSGKTIKKTHEHNEN